MNSTNHRKINKGDRLRLFVMSSWLLCIAPLLSYALPSDQYQPYYITSNSIEYNGKLRTITYIGNVKIKQGSTRIRGDKVIVYESPKRAIVREVVYGNLAHYSTVPQIGKNRLYAQANRIDYRPTTNTVLLINNGRVTQGKNSFTGEHIWYNVALEEVRTKPKGHKMQTVIVIQPQQQVKPQNA